MLACCCAVRCRTRVILPVGSELHLMLFDNTSTICDCDLAVAVAVTSSSKVLTLGFTDGTDRAGVTRVRVRVFDPSEGTHWLTWPSSDPDADAEVGTTVELIRDDTPNRDGADGPVTAGVLQFTVSTTGTNRFAEVGMYSVTEFRIEDATGQ